MVRGLLSVLDRIEEIRGLLGECAGRSASVSAPTAGKPFDAVLSQAVRTSAGSQSGDRAQINALISEAASRYGVDKRLVDAVVRAESNYNPRCVSRAGAKGLMQLMPENCRDFSVSDPFDPAQNIDGGVRHLKQMLDTFGSLDLSLAAYNAGSGAVRRYGGIPPYRETQAYVDKIMGWLAEANDER